MPHEKSVSVGEPPNIFLVPSVINGIDIGPDAAVRAWERGALEPLEGPFKTFKAAKDAADERSNPRRRKERPKADTPASILFPNQN